MTTRKIIYGSLAMIAVLLLSFSIVVFFYTPHSIGYKSDIQIEPTLPPVRDDLSVLFVGDMMFDRGVRNTVKKNGYEYVFGDSENIFRGSDLVIGNLEGPITSSPSATVYESGQVKSNALIFTFPISTAQALKDNGVNIVSLANNHEDNFGQSGIAETKKYLTLAGIQYFGDPSNATEISTTTCKNNICIGLIGFHEFSYMNKENIIEKIRELRPVVDHIVIFSHWGEEYSTDITPSQQALAHQWIDEGADLVIGAHPHVVEPIETYKGKTIFYSLGNYIFDQYFSFNTTHAIAARIDFKKDGYTYDIVPIQTTGITISIPDATTTERILNGIKRLP